MISPNWTYRRPHFERNMLELLIRSPMFSECFSPPESSWTNDLSSMIRSYPIEIGTSLMSVPRSLVAESKTMESSPYFGGSAFPVRERPPSKKNSMVKPSAISFRKYASTRAGYRESSWKLLRMKKAPPRRRSGPMGQKLRLSPAAMIGGIIACP